MSRRLLAVGATLLLGLPVLVAALLAGPAQAASYCTFSDRVVRASIPAGHVVRLLAYPDGTIHYVDNSDSSRSARCGRATITNTRKVVVHGRGSSSRLIYVQDHHPFAPGYGNESGRDEVEFVLDGVTSLWLFGRDDADHPDLITVGERGLDLNGDGDVDVRNRSGLREIEVFAFRGDDEVDAGGGSGTGAAWPRRKGLIADGMDGADRLTGRPGRDVLYGDNGADVVRGGQGADALQGGAGTADGPDLVHGGRGPDVIDGGWAADELYGGEGDDYLDAFDDDPDVDQAVDGGSGHDQARVNDGDPRTSLEEILPPL